MSTVERFNVQLVSVQTGVVGIADLKFSARVCCLLARENDDFVVVKIKPCYREVGFGLNRFLFDGARAALAVQLNDTVSLGIRTW